MYPHTASYSNEQSTQEAQKSAAEVSPRIIWSFEQTLRALKAKASAEKEKYRMRCDLQLWHGLGVASPSEAFGEALDVTRQMRELLE